MKQSTLLVAAATLLLSSASMNAQETVVPYGSKTGISKDHFQASAMPAEYRILDSIANAFSYYSGNQRPFVYDQYLNLLATIKRGSPTAPQNGNELYIRVSPDLGVSWSTPIGPLHDETAAGSGGARYPTLLTNPTHSTNPSEYFHFYTAPVLLGGAFGGRVTGLVSQSGAEVIPATTTSDLGNGDMWSSSGISVETAAGDAIVTLGGTNDNAIAMSRLDLNSGQVTESIVADASLFSVPETEGSYTATVGGFDRDASGAMYALIWARTPGFDAETVRDQPMPHIIKSNDGGMTWTAPMMLPWSSILAYNAASGMNGNPDSISLFYSPVGFAVTGTDQYSIVFGLYDIDASKTDGQQHIVEARYSGGAWTLSKVADFFSGWYNYEGGGSPSNQMDNEIQVARTADGTRLVAKWAQLFNYTFEQDIDGDGDSPDTLTTADILMSVSNVGSGVWSDPANVTESAIHDRLSWIPTPVVPNDLTNLPLLTVASRPADDETTIAAQLLASQLWVAERTQLVLISNVDATASSGAAPIAGESVSSRIASIVPNPTTGSARVTLDVARAGNGSVEIWSSLGERVATLASGTLRAGTQSFTLDGVELPLGAYYVAMKIDGRTVTMPFSVVR